MGYLKSKEPKRHVVTMRMSDSMRERINAAATTNSRSVSQEIESRLERSLQEETLLGGSETTLLAKLVASAVALIEIESGKPWNEDRMTWEAVNSAVRTILISFQPEIDLDIWERHRDLLLNFMDGVYELAAVRREIEGLAKAYPTKTDFPPEIRSIYEKAWAEYPTRLERVKELAKAVYEGPMTEHEERRKPAVRMGRELAVSRSASKSGNFVVGGVTRMFKRSGAFEPLPGLKDTSDLTDDELFECVRRLAGQPAEDPDMEADAFATRKPSWLDLRDDDS